MGNFDGGNLVYFFSPPFLRFFLLKVNAIYECICICIYLIHIFGYDATIRICSVSMSQFLFTENNTWFKFRENL